MWLEAFMVNYISQLGTLNNTLVNAEKQRRTCKKKSFKMLQQTAPSRMFSAWVVLYTRKEIGGRKRLSSLKQAHSLE